MYAHVIMLIISNVTVLSTIINPVTVEGFNYE